eukprot:752869-Amorphochlora_amoeboformis.AAC.1
MTEADLTSTAFETVMPARYVSSSEIVVETSALPTSARGSNYLTEPSVAANITVALDGQSYTPKSSGRAGFLYYFPPHAYSMTRRIGYYQQSISLNLTGRFYNTTRVFVRFSNQDDLQVSECSYHDAIQNDTATISCTVPIFASGGGQYAVGVSVDNPDSNGGQIRFNDTLSFLYYDNSFPVTHSVSPAYATYTSLSEANFVLSMSQILNTGISDLAKRSDFTPSALIGNGTHPYTSLSASINLRTADFLDITIDNTASEEDLTDYQLGITVNVSNFLSIGSISNYLDLVFYDSDSLTMLYWWTEPSQANTSNAKFWIKVPLIPRSSTKVIYLAMGAANIETSYYYKPSAVFDYFDNVGTAYDTEKWCFSRTGSYSINEASGLRQFSGSARFQMAPRANVTPGLRANDTFIVEMEWAATQPFAETSNFTANAFPESDVRYW